MIVWKFALYLGVITLLFAFIGSVVAITRYGRGGQHDDAQRRVSHNDDMRGSLSS